MSTFIYLRESDEPFTKEEREEFVQEYGTDSFSRSVRVTTYKELIKAIREENDNRTFGILRVYFREYNFYVYLMEEESRDMTFTSLSSGNGDVDMGIMVFPQFFDLSWRAQWFVLAHEIGHHVTSDVTSGYTINSTRLAYPMINGHPSRYEIEADKYAYQILKTDCIRAMTEIYNYLLHNSKRPDRAREVGARIKALKADHTRPVHINGIPEYTDNWLQYRASKRERPRLKTLDELDIDDQRRIEKRLELAAQTVAK